MWKSGLCDCFGDCETLAWGYFFPCGLYGRTTERFGKAPLINDSTCIVNTAVFLVAEAFAGIGCVLVGMQRQMIREKYGIPGDAMSDFCTGCCCPCCALMQHYREIAARESLAPQTPQVAQVGYQQPAVVYAPVTAVAPGQPAVVYATAPQQPAVAVVQPAQQPPPQ